MRTTSALFLFAASAAFAQQPAEFKAPKEIAPGVFEVGVVKLDKNTSTVTVPAKVNMVDGLVEYLMVTPQGAVHESVLVSDAQPQDVHMAMLLLGAKGMAQDKTGKAPERIDAEYLAKAPALTGDKLTLNVAWKGKDGTEKTARAEQWIVRRVPVPKKPSRIVPAPDGPWLYTGSYFFENRFLAQTEGVFASVVAYPSALINNPREGAKDDHMWFVNKETIPPKDTPVTFTIKLEAAAPAPAAKESQPAPKEPKKPTK
jgi:hypothetical protein